MNNPEQYLDEMVAGLGQTERFEKKSSELIKNLENERIIQFVKVFCAIEHNAALGTIAEEKRTKLLMDLMKILNEISYDESGMFDRYCEGFYKTDETLKKYFPGAYENQDDIFKHYLDEKIPMPDISQMEFAINRGFGKLIFMPGKKNIPNIKITSHELPFISIRGKMLESYEYPEFFFPLALSDESNPFMISDGFSFNNEKFNGDRVRELFQKSQEKICEENNLGIDLQGFSFREYLFMQMSHNANINPNLYTPDYLPQLFLDEFTLNKYALIFEDKLKNGFILARYESGKNQFRFERAYDTGVFTCAPWLALNFKKREEADV